MKTRFRRIKDEYLELVRRFPLRPIRNDEQHALAVSVLASLDGKPKLSIDESDYANTLAMLIKNFEATWQLPNTGLIERLRYLMNESGMNVTGLGKIIGSQPEASMVLAGKRELSKDHIRRLSTHFKLEPGYFL